MKAQGLTKETINNYGISSELNFPKFNTGDTIAVSTRIKEGDKDRIQVFQGDVIAIKHNGISSTFTVRKIAANNVAVERIFPFHSPLIDSIQFIRRGKVRRAKAYYVRGRVGKAAKFKEKIISSAALANKAAANSPVQNKTA
jgi:large subunit ribosomal protein L19